MNGHFVCCRYRWYRRTYKCTVTANNTEVHLLYLQCYKSIAQGTRRVSVLGVAQQKAKRITGLYDVHLSLSYYKAVYS